MEKELAMNNVIFFFVDSVFSDCLGKEKTEYSSTPVIDSLIENSMFADSVFSYGPYTDAATKGLYCGMKSLDDYGYYFEFNFSNENIYKTFKEAGFETYGFYYPYNIYGNKIEQYIDHSIFTSGFLFESELDRKYSLYATKQHISEIEYKILIKETDLLFDAWKRFYNNIEKQNESDVIIKDCKTEKGKGKNKLNEEIKKYEEDKIKYIDGVLKLGKNHPLFEINEYDINESIDKKSLRKFYKNNRRFFFKLAEKELALNLKNTKFRLSEYKKNKKYLLMYTYLHFASTYTKVRSLKRDWRINCSGGKQVDAFLSLLKEGKIKSPFYVQFDTEEPHNNISFFTYDNNDEQKRKKEIEYLKPLVKNLGDKFSGNLTYQLALRYIDYQVGRIVTELKNKEILENTTIIITADHGSSYAIGNTKGDTVNNFHTENYKTPLIIWNPLNKEYVFKTNAMYSAEDTLPTILNSLNMDVPSQYKGMNIKDNKKGRDFVITEYMGPGVPDMISRDIWLSIRDQNYILAYKININSEVEDVKPVEIYDLSRDKLEIKNIVNKYDGKNIRIEYLNKKAIERFIEI